MVTEHSVVYGNPSGTHRTVTRTVFTTRDGRVLGTETVTKHWFTGQFGGWTFEGESSTTVAFATEREAADWIDEMFRAHEMRDVPFGPRAPRCVFVA